MNDEFKHVYVFENNQFGNQIFDALIYSRPFINVHDARASLLLLKITEDPTSIGDGQLLRYASKLVNEMSEAERPLSLIIGHVANVSALHFMLEISSLGAFAVARVSDEGAIRDFDCRRAREMMEKTGISVSSSSTIGYIDALVLNVSDILNRM